MAIFGTLNTWIIIVAAGIVVVFMLLILPILVHKHKKKKLAKKAAKWQKKHPGEDYVVDDHKTPGLFRFITGLIKFALFIGVLGAGVVLLPMIHQKEASKVTREKYASEAPYGQKVEVDGKNINVVVEGEGSDVLVLYPTAKVSTPYLYYKPLTSVLTSKFKVVTVEPFGYGLSDATDKERTLENAVDELHMVISSLGYTNYSIATNGFGGIPMMEYVNTYKDEVKAYYGIDSMVAKLNEYYNFVGDLDNVFSMLGRFYNDFGYRRIVSTIKVDMILPQTDYTYSAEDKELYRQMALAYNDTEDQLEEIKNGPTWCTNTTKSYTPADVPSCTFVSSDYAAYIADLLSLANKSEVTYSIGGESKTVKAADFWAEAHNNPLNEKNLNTTITGKNIATSCASDIATRMIDWFDSL